VVVFLAERGDKTQLDLLLAADYNKSTVGVFAVSAGTLVFSNFIAVGMWDLSTCAMISARVYHEFVSGIAPNVKHML
jgi:putative Ca2+/H+ antiporter (TMEM165/GDT1 family)